MTETFVENCLPHEATNPGPQLSLERAECFLSFDERPVFADESAARKRTLSLDPEWVEGHLPLMLAASANISKDEIELQIIDVDNGGLVLVSGGENDAQKLGEWLLNYMRGAIDFMKCELLDRGFDDGIASVADVH